MVEMGLKFMLFGIFTGFCSIVPLIVTGDANTEDGLLQLPGYLAKLFQVFTAMMIVLALGEVIVGLIMVGMGVLL